VLPVPADSPVMLTVAVLRKPKGIQYMIEAMPMILTAVPDAKYIIVGDGAYGDTLKQAAQEMAGESIIFTGTRQDIPELLAASDLFVLPTLQLTSYRKIFFINTCKPLALVEAQALTWQAKQITHFGYHQTINGLKLILRLTLSGRVLL